MRIRRTALKRLEEWWNDAEKKPLVLRGARQVGKSTLVRHFAVDLGLTLREINLEQHRPLDALFATLDPHRILMELEGLVGPMLSSPDVLLFLDEIQACPQALPALRYLHEAYPSLPLIAAGSLLEFVLSNHQFSMPVGRIGYLHLFPLTLEEVLLTSDPDLLPWIQQFQPGGEIPDTAHARLLQHQREFLLVGGMPEAMDVYLRTQDIDRVAAIQRSIVGTYRDDFSKYASQAALARLQRVFDSAARMVGQKVSYTRLARDERSREVRAAVELLSKARVVTPVLHSHCSGLPLQADIDPEIYKLLFMDIGLMNRINGLDWLDISSLPPGALINEGAMAEQFIGQHLLGLDGGLEDPRLFYWLRHRKSANAEVDYVISRGRLVVPIEVKAGKSGSLRSLWQFVHEKGVSLAVRFDLNPPSLYTVQHRLRQSDSTAAVHCSLLSLPLYMVGQLPRLLDSFRSAA